MYQSLVDVVDKRTYSTFKKALEVLSNLTILATMYIENETIILGNFSSVQWLT